MSVAAAALLIGAVAVAAAAIAGGDGADHGGPPTATEPSTTETALADGPATTGAPDTAPSTTWDPTVVADRATVATGFALASLPRADGGASAVVFGPEPAGGPVPCAVPEGATLAGIEPDGSLRPLTLADGSPVRSTSWVLVAPRRSAVAVVERCEDGIIGIHLGTVGPDGLPTDLRTIADPDLGLPAGPDRFPAGVAYVHWTGDGTRLLVTGAVQGDDTPGERHTWAYEVADASWVPRDDVPVGAVDVVELADGTVVTLQEQVRSLRVVVDGGGTDVEADHLALAPDGRSAIAVGTDGAHRVDGTGASELLAGATSSAAVLPGGRAVVTRAFPRPGPGEVQIRLLDDEGLPVGDPVSLGTAIGPPVPLADGSGLLVTQGSTDPAATDTPTVERWTFAEG